MRNGIGESRWKCLPRTDTMRHTRVSCVPGPAGRDFGLVPPRWRASARFGSPAWARGSPTREHHWTVAATPVARPPTVSCAVGSGWYAATARAGAAAARWAVVTVAAVFRRAAARGSGEAADRAIRPARRTCQGAETGRARCRPGPSSHHNCRTVPARRNQPTVVSRSSPDRAVTLPAGVSPGAPASAWRPPRRRTRSTASETCSRGSHQPPAPYRGTGNRPPNATKRSGCLDINGTTHPVGREVGGRYRSRVRATVQGG